MNSMGYASKDAPPAPCGHIGTGVEEQDKLLHLLMEELSSLEGTLNPLLLPVGPATASSGQAQGPQAVPVRSGLASRMEDLNLKLRSQIDRVRYLTSRVDL